ncbi:serine hydrolase domain-containing protein [Phaeobacter porticola]|uniref:Putative beta-lactamase n=1 Tax=Phaeobacter porticola TaxID=1844006 RepID=A0A1L3I7Z5_9RHOB|nr:serine hydrolase [Phaeobacter porticola]APG48240.1 putative beta-lactamase [Phaeobacter porticola]
MRRLLKLLSYFFIIFLICFAALAYWQREALSRLIAVNSLFDADRIVSNFSNMNAAFLTTPLDRGDGSISALPVGVEMALPAGTQDWITDRRVTSLLVLKGGQVRHESYYQGTYAEDLRISWSMAKSYLSALLGVLLQEDKIHSLDDLVVDYAPQLRGSAYETATIRNVLNMASGVKFDEDYLDYNSDINRMGRTLALGGTLDQFASDLTETIAPPGDAWHYVSIDTHVLGMVIRGATGRAVPELLSEKILQHLGLEQAGYYLTDGAGVAFVLGGINQTTRDYGRFGLMIAQNGRYSGKQVVPQAWISASTRPSAPTKAAQIGYGFQWWIPKNAVPGEFLARGVYGQYIYINQSRDVVIVVTSTDRGFRNPGVADANIRMLRRLAKSL